MIFELDAVVAHLYGLNAEQLKHIFATFHVGWDYHERLQRRAGTLPQLGGATVSDNFNRPEFIDNRDGREMVAALRGHLNWLADTYKDPVSVDIATGYFHPAALALLRSAARDKGCASPARRRADCAAENPAP